MHDLISASRYRKSTKIVVEGSGPNFCGFDVANLGGERRQTTREKVRLIRHLLQQTNVDIIVVQQHLPTASAIAAMTELPVVLHVHNYQKAYSNSPVRRLRRFFRSRRYARLAGIIHVSESCLKYFERHWPEVRVPQTVIYNGIDLRAWTPARARSEEILCVARSAPEKGILEVATAIAQVLQQRQGWRARFILSETDRWPDYHAKVLHALAPVRESTTIEIDKPFAHVKQCNEQAAIAVVAPTWQEPFGRTCLEAHAGGCAVISSGTGGLGEISGPSARYVSHGQSRAIANACLELIDDGAGRQRLASAGRLEAERFDHMQLARQLDDFQNSIVQNARLASGLKASPNAMPN